MYFLKDQRGFTLIELMAVIFIIAITMGITLAMFSESGSKLESEAGKMATLIRTMDDMATARKQPLELEFDLKEHKLTWKTSASGEESREFDTLYSVEALSIGEVKEGQVKLVFDPSRTTEAILVHFENDDERMTVKYSPLVRRVKLIGPEKKS